MIRLDLPAPFAVEATLTAALGSSFGNHYQAVAPGTVRGLLPAGRPNRQAVVEFAFADGRLTVRQIGDGGDEDEDLAALARRVWSLDDDLVACHSVLAADAGLGPLAERYRGCRLLRAPDLWEPFVVAVVGQAVSAAAARSIRGRLAARLGTLAQVAGREYRAHPSPGQLLAAGPEAIRGCGLTAAKAACLLAVAEQAEGGELRPERFSGLSEAEAVVRLTAIPGVGRWTAEVVLIYGLGYSDVFRPGDRALANAVQQLRGLAGRPSPEELAAIAQAWRPWRSYAAAYLLQAWRGQG